MIQEFGTGLIPDGPDTERPCAHFSASGIKVLSIPEIVQELKQPGRVPSRQQFGPEWIKNQASTNGCTGWAAAGVLERSRVRCGHDPVRLAGAGVWTQLNGGRNVGTNIGDAIGVMQSVGCPPEDLCDDLVVISKRAIPQKAWDAASRFRVAKGEFFWARTEEELGTGILNGFIAGVAVTANGRRGTPWWQLDDEGIVRSGNGGGNHAVGLDDVTLTKRETLKFDMFNSWTTDYGQQGRAFLTWKGQLSGPANQTPFYLVRAVSDDPQGHNPPVIA